MFSVNPKDTTQLFFVAQNRNFHTGSNFMADTTDFGNA